MVTRVGDVAVRVGADIAPLQRNLRAAGATLSQFGRTVAINATRVAAWGAAAAVAGAAVGAALVKRAMDAIGATADLAASLNTTTESLTILQRAANLAGVENLNGALAIFNRNISNAAAGTGPAIDALAALGLKASDLVGLDLHERIDLIGARMTAFIPPAQQAALAADLFGRSGAQMLNVLRDGEGIGEAARQVRGFGLALSQVDSAKIEVAGDMLDSLGPVIEGIITQITVQLAPVIYGIGKAFQEAAIDAGGFRSSIQSAFGMVVTAIGWGMDAVHDFRRDIKGTEVEIAWLVNAWDEACAAVRGAVIAAGQAIVSGFRTAITAAAQAVIAHVNALIRALNVAIDGASWLDKKLGGDGFTRIGEIGQVAADAFGGIGEAASAAADGLNTVDARAAASEARLINLRREMQEMTETRPSDGLRDWLAGVNAEIETVAESAALAREEFMGLGMGGEEGGEGESGGYDKGKSTKGGGSDRNALAEEMARRLATLQEGLATEREVIQAEYESRMQLLREALEKRMLTEDEYRTLSLRAEEAYQKSMSDLARTAANERAEVTGGMLDNLITLSRTGSKKMFQIAKIASLAQAIVKGREAVVSAYAAGARIGGPALGAAYAATAFAATAAQIASLRSTSMGGAGYSKGGSGGGSGGRSRLEKVASRGRDGGGSSERPLDVRVVLPARGVFSSAQVADLLDALTGEARDRGVRMTVVH